MDKREIILVVLGVIVGICLVMIYQSFLTNRLEGLWIQSASWTEAYDTANKMDEKGDWVCVNINKMDYERAIEVCNHEVGHEIFSEVCEKNINKCLGVVNGN